MNGSVYELWMNVTSSCCTDRCGWAIWTASANVFHRVLSPALRHRLGLNHFKTARGNAWRPVESLEIQTQDFHPFPPSLEIAPAIYTFPHARRFPVYSR